MSGWQDIRTIPTDRPVMVRTATGIECRARTRLGPVRWVKRADRYGPARVGCYRLREDDSVKGDVSAVAWREL